MNETYFFEVGVRYDKTMENGVVKPVTELYIIEAVSFTEAEARAIEMMQPFISGDFRVVKEKITNINEVIRSDKPTDDRFYKVKHNIITIDEKTAKEKRTPMYLLFEASSNDDARDRYYKHIKDWLADCELDTIAETKYMDYYEQ
jgi:hypothetical protein